MRPLHPDGEEEAAIKTFKVPWRVLRRYLVRCCPTRARRRPDVRANNEGLRVHFGLSYF